MTKAKGKIKFNIPTSVDKVYKNYFIYPKGKTHDIFFLENSFIFKKKLFLNPTDNKGKKNIVQNEYWTCNFHCPITNEVIGPGIIRDEHKSSLFSPPSRKRSLTSTTYIHKQDDDDGVIYYRNRSTALEACCAKIFDHIPLHVRQQFYRGENIDRNKYPSNFCEDDLDINVLEALASVDFHRNVIQNKDLIPLVEENSFPIQPVDSAENEKGIMNRAQILKKLHRSYYDPSISGNKIERIIHKSITITSFNDEVTGKTWWHAEFTSPISNETFTCGTSTYRESKIINGQTYYEQENWARRAAIQRATDCFVHRGGWTNTTTDDFKFDKKLLNGYVNFCKEEPYDSEEIYSVKPLQDIINSKYDEGDDVDVYQNVLISRNNEEIISSKFDDQNEAVKDDFINEENDAKQNLDKTRKMLQPIDEFRKLLISYDPAMHDTNFTKGMTYLFLYTHFNDEVTGKTWWHAEFTTPVSNETFKCGTLKHLESKNINGQIYYQTKTLARSATIGRAVDCFAHRGGWTNTNADDFKFDNKYLVGYDNFCMEAPYDSEEIFSVQVLPEQPKMDINQTNQMMISKLAPKSIIYSRYNALLSEPLPRDNFSTVSIEIGDDNIEYWTSTFECPLTGRTFLSGTLKEYLNETNGDEIIPKMISVNGMVYYRSKKDAEHAASGRANDVLSSINYFASYGVSEHIIVPQFCDEDPHSYFLNEGLQRDEELDYGEDDDYVIQEVPQAGSKMQGSNALEAVLEAWVDSSTTLHNPIEKYRLPNNTKSIFTTDIITTAKAWFAHMEDEMIAISEEKNQPFHQNMQSDYSMTKVFSLLQAPVTISSCNAILKALGNANNQRTNNNTSYTPGLDDSPESPILLSDHSKFIQDSTLNLVNKSPLHLLIIEEIKSLPKSDNYEERTRVRSYDNSHIDDIESVEDIATNIITLILRMSELSQKDIHRPNTETFNQFLRCLRRTNAYETALAAESYLNNLQSGGLFHGLANIKPDTQSFNAVMQHFSSVHNNLSSHQKLFELFFHLCNDPDLKPDKTSFLIALKGLAKYSDNEVFDVERAIQWKNSIDEYLLEHKVPSFDFDVDMYNALIPKLDSIQELNEKLQIIFEDGFRHDDNTKATKAIQNAENLEKWISFMEHRSHTENDTYLFPNTKTFEALIYAWIKTGTQNGLLRAEYWANQALEASSTEMSDTARLETFYPIVSAWAQSGENLGIEKVEKWIDKLSDMSSTSPHLHPDYTIRSKLIIAKCRNQELSSRNHINSSLDIGEEIDSSAKDCSDSLLQLLHEIKQAKRGNIDNFDISPFEATLDSWNRCISPTLGENEIQNIVTEMLGNINTFKEFRMLFYESCLTQEKKFQAMDANNSHSLIKTQDPKLIKLLSDTASLYKRFISYLRQHNSIQPDMYFHHVEKLFRHYETQEPCCGNLQGTRISRQTIDFYNEALEWCKALHHPTQYGDTIRLAMYIFDQCKQHYEHQRLEEIEMLQISHKIIDIVNSAIPRDNEKRMILRRIWGDLDAFGVEPTSASNDHISDIIYQEARQNTIKGPVHKRGRSRRQRVIKTIL